MTCRESILFQYFATQRRRVRTVRPPAAASRAAGAEAAAAAVRRRGLALALLAARTRLIRMLS